MSELNENYHEKLTEFDGTNCYEFESDMMYHLMAYKLWAVVSNPKAKNEEKLIFDKVAEETWLGLKAMKLGNEF
jgi:hypothetical protein